MSVGGRRRGRWGGEGGGGGGEEGGGRGGRESPLKYIDKHMVLF